MQKASVANKGYLWAYFVWLSLFCALLPGFGLAALMTSARVFSIPHGTWYTAAVQIHATSLLVGWGGTMILGVGLHFLPRLRGVKLFRPAWAATLFWVLTAGLFLRFFGQLALAFLIPPHDAPLRLLLNSTTISGIFLQTIAVAGLLLLLAKTFRAGRPLKENKGFQQIAPLLIVAASTLLLAQLLGCWGACVSWHHGFDLAILPLPTQRAFINLMLFGFIMAMATGMSARLFPLTFRTHSASQRGLKITAAFLTAGSLFSLGEALSPHLIAWDVWIAFFYGSGILSGTFSARIFYRRKIIPHATTAYHMREDPAAVGVATAYFWAILTAVFLFTFALEKTGIPFPISMTQENLARHTMGAGFMTLLIISVGWKMLPGFGGCLPHGRRYLWGAIALGNATVLLRITSLLFFGDNNVTHTGSTFLLPLAGILGIGTILAFMRALQISYRRQGK